LTLNPPCRPVTQEYLALAPESLDPAQVVRMESETALSGVEAVFTI